MLAQPETGRPSLILKRRINAPPARVYAAWINGQTLARWWTQTPADLLEATIDARPGGRFFILFRHGGEEHGVGGEYREAIENEKLAFTWAWRSTPERESFVTVTFRPDGDGTMLTLLHEQFFDEKARDSHDKGWSMLLDQLARLFA